jgi:TonB family protein
MMKLSAAVLAVASSMMLTPALFAQGAAGDDDIVKGLQNLSGVHRIANVLELRRTLAHTLPLQVPSDPWGTPYRISESPVGYRIVSAGSDKKFDDSVALTRQQFTGLEGDVVFEDGKLTRSNRNWLYTHAQSAGLAATALEELNQTEMDFVMMRVPIMRALIGAKATVNTMQAAGTFVQEKHAAPPAELANDAWGTPMRVTIGEDGSYRIISAGADRTFDETSWTRVAAPDFAEDFIFENGKLTRYVDQTQALHGADLTSVAVSQPPDASLAGSGPWVKIEPPITAPVAVDRVEPVYPDDYRRARISGTVVLEAGVSEKGTVDNIAVLRSVAPGLDMAAANAVRQWKFKPAMRDGKPVPVLFNLSINFQLK